MLALLLLLAVATTARAADLYIYLTPSGDRVVTNRPVSLPGYVLEHSGLNARNAGQRLRDPGGLRGRAEIEQHINTAASQYQLDADLIRAVIRQESNFQVNARSHKGAMGLMQLMPATAAQYQVSNITDPRENIHAGTAHLKYLLQRYRNLDLALAAYNAGETAVARYQGIPPYPETQAYVSAVKRWYRGYQ
ncbi:MAG TPA: lytic transglycosylase domain-containing protein [Saccharospirillum sp.]|nr:lytic transglycosylase domain-containing protein [Saccharospirillum sp.]